MAEEKETDVVVKNPHDATFKKVMKDKTIAKDILQHNLPQDMVQDIDLTTMELLDGSFVSESLRESFSDVLYGVEVATHKVYVAFLLEHKSYSDRLAVFQVGRYVMDVWEKVFQERGEVPIVFPIIFYHGTSEWTHETDIRKYIKHYEQLPAYMHERLPTLKHDFITMQTHTERQMYVYNPLTRLILRSFKFINYSVKRLIKELLISIDEMQGHVPDEVIQRYVELILFYYTQANKDVTEQMLFDMIRKLDGKGAHIVTILEARERKGRQEGIEQGIERGIEQGIERGKKEAKEEFALEMLRDGFPVEKVATYSKLSVEKIERLQQQIQR